MEDASHLMPWPRQVPLEAATRPMTTMCPTTVPGESARFNLVPLVDAPCPTMTLGHSLILGLASLRSQMELTGG